MIFEQSLAEWLPKQRWYSGTEAPIRDLAITADVTLSAGDPELRHLIVTASQDGHLARYQILAGCREQLPASLRHAVIGPAPGGKTAYDALHDPALARVLLRGIASQRSTGPLRFVAEPGAQIDHRLDARLLTAEQTNTSLVFGDASILKVLRRPFPGCNPDLEVARALSRLGSARVAAPLGWIETRLDGEPTLLAVLSRYLPGASDGWSLAVRSLRDRPARAAPGFTGEAHLLGRATAEMHADLATALGTGRMAPLALAELADQMTRELDLARSEVRQLDRHAAKLRAAYAGLGEITSPVDIQRVHGDFHLGQVLRTRAGWVALDFEGEPAIPLARRRARYPVLKDVAGMLRSFDYAARHQLLGQSGAEQPRAAAQVWVERCQAAFCDGYAQAGGLDPQANAVLLRALMLQKAVYEVIYEARYRPGWLSIPLESIAAA
jgi:maltokinase